MGHLKNVLRFFRGVLDFIMCLGTVIEIPQTGTTKSSRDIKICLFRVNNIIKIKNNQRKENVEEL